MEELLSSYPTSSDDEEGQSTDQDDTDSCEQPVKVALPPPPDLIQLRQKGRHRDEPSQHQQRVRTFAHVQGNYPSHVFIPVPLSEHLEELVDDLASVCRREMLDVHRFTPHECLPLGDLVDQSDWRGPQLVSTHCRDGGSKMHVSLSRSFPLRRHHIEPFVRKLSECLASSFRCSVGLDALRCFKNDTNSRSFATLMVDEGGRGEICKLISCVDEALITFGQRTYYDDPLPHTAFAWWLGGFVDDDALPSPLRQRQLASRSSFQIDSVYCVIGQLLYRIPLEPTPG
eukprot:TRINITY_DN6885_c0_g1_i1.p1 TRINITY_DN6885_c0_g1~~TRINITY_DN6885_c0_g1_i1.p1  ORF type:complete len:286 (+),score=39.76 TRINITY_DN6885_c0_g1_i1:151-1008(+)